MGNENSFWQRLEQSYIQRPFIYYLLLLALFLVIFWVTTGVCLASQSKKAIKAVTEQKDSAKLRETRYHEKALVSKKAGDSISHQLLVDMQTNYEYRLNNVLADLRQAHNDTISSLSIHFGFWICLIGLVGGIAPLLSNTFARKRINRHIKAKEKEMEWILKYAELRSDEERFYITVQNIRALANLGRVYFMQDIREQTNKMFDKLICYNNNITSKCDFPSPSTKEGEERKKHEPDILIYSTSLLSLVQQLRIVYSSRIQLHALDMINEIANEMKKNTTNITEWCTLVKELNGYLTVLKRT